jgi:nicotinamide mononucleotide adenylyltransferase
MNKMDLGTWLAERIITEDNGIDKVIAIYPGRFQPFGKHHKEAYDWLAKQFGKENTFIATADNMDSKGKIKDKSPFTFDQKKSIISAMGVPKSQIVKTNPYQPYEITGKYINNGTSTTAVVFGVGDKDMREDPRFQVKKLKIR